MTLIVFLPMSDRQAGYACWQMFLLLFAVPTLLPIALALFGIGRRSHYVVLSGATFVLALFTGLVGREVKSEVLFGVWAVRSSNVPIPTRPLVL